jgi:hypothetical protein
LSTIHSEITGRLAEFISEQPVFFVGTAPLSGDGHVNLSPKGGTGTLQILDPHTVAYVDLTGSGSETIAHLKENGRITVMLCAFTGPPNIVRLHGRGRVVAMDDPEFVDLAGRFPPMPGVRAVIVVAVERISDSCGYAVPFMEYVGDRDLLSRWAERKGDDGLAEYRERKNSASIDGLPAIDW